MRLLMLRQAGGREGVESLRSSQKRTNPLLFSLAVLRYSYSSSQLSRIASGAPPTSQPTLARQVQRIERYNPPSTKSRAEPIHYGLVLTSCLIKSDFFHSPHPPLLFPLSSENALPHSRSDELTNVGTRSRDE